VRARCYARPLTVKLIEYIGVVLGIVTVWLAVRRVVWTFPLAIVSVTLLGWVVYHQRLYSDALLQAFFVLANVYGWIKWRQAGADSRPVAVERMTGREIAAWALGGAAVAVAWAWATATFTDATRPWWDAPTLVASVAAQVLMGQRRLENWLLWIAVDLALIPLYAVQQLYGLAALYMVYLILSVWGWVDWRRAWASERSGVPA
jgi:nicotinamide mononucleotide transporter